MAPVTAIHLWVSPLVSENKKRRYLFKAVWQVNHMESKVLSQPILFLLQCGGKLPETATLITSHGADVWKMQNQKWNKKKTLKNKFCINKRVYNYHSWKKVNAYFIFSSVKHQDSKQWKHWHFDLISVLLKLTITRISSNTVQRGNKKQISVNLKKKLFFFF